MSLNATRHVSRTSRGVRIPHRTFCRDELRRELIEIEYLIDHFGSASAMVEHIYDYVVYH